LITPPDTQTATAAPEGATAILGTEDPAAERVEAEPQFCPKGFVADLTSPPSSQIAVAFPFASTATEGEDPPAPERVSAALQEPFRRRVFALTLFPSTQTATVFPFGSVAKLGLEALTPALERSTGGAHIVTASIGEVKMRKKRERNFFMFDHQGFVLTAEFIADDTIKPERKVSVKKKFELR